MIYDLTIIGGGPAGVSAGVYAARKKLKTLFITEKFEGQSVVSSEIQNWIGTISISGTDLSKNLENHLKSYRSGDINIKEKEQVEKVNKTKNGFLILTNKSKYNSKAILVATGSHRRKLQILGANEFENKGITYCASCDGPLYKKMDVIVIGGGNAGFETAAQLLSYSKSVTLLEANKDFAADPVTIKRLLQNPKMKALKNSSPVEIKGDKFVSSIIYKNKETGKINEIPAKGIFVEIGHTPSTEFISHLIKLDEKKQIIVDPKTQQTSVKGIWAAGDCTDVLYHQNNIACGDSIKALEDIYIHLKTK